MPRALRCEFPWCLLCADSPYLTNHRHPPGPFSGSPEAYDPPLRQPLLTIHLAQHSSFFCNAVLRRALYQSQKEGYAIFSHFVLLRVGAAWPRLGRAFRTAPVSRQTINQERFVTNRAFTHALPPSSGLRSVPSPVSPCFFSLPLK